MLKRTTEASGVNSVEKLNTVLVEPSFPLLTELFPITFGRGKASHSYEVSGVIPTGVEGENQGHTPILPSYAGSWEPPGEDTVYLNQIACKPGDECKGAGSNAFVMLCLLADRFGVKIVGYATYNRQLLGEDDERL